MADKFTIRITKDLPEMETIDGAAATLGMTKNQLVTEGVKMMCAWDKVFYSKMKAYADGLGISMAQVMQNLLIKRLADDAAADTVWGGNRELLLEFSMTNKGLITGKELFEMLYNDKVNQLYRERAQGIKRRLQDGEPETLLTEDEKEVLKKYGA
jgi:hypothetical protein